MVELLGFEPKSYEFTLVLIVVETFLSPVICLGLHRVFRELLYTM